MTRRMNEAWVRYLPMDGAHHHVAVVRRPWRRTRFYVDGKRVRRWHPYLRALRRRPYPREVLGL